MSLKIFLLILGLSIVPVSEIRGAVIYGLSLLDQSFINILLVYGLSVIGNMLPVPFIMLLFRPIIHWLKKTKLFGKMAHWLERRTSRKAEEMMEKGSKIGAFALYLFVAIPLPTTGAWTGAMIASLLDIRFKYALPAILLGVMTAGIIMVLLMTGVLNLGALGQWLLAN